MAKSDAAATPHVRNRKATHKFDVIERVEVGISLTGSEVKSIRNGHISIEEAYARIDAGEAWLLDCTIQPYAHAGPLQPKSNRPRRLLLHRREIRKLQEQVTQQGLTLVPLDLYFNESGRIKLSLALCRGKKLHDKRADLQKREHQRDMDRAMKRGRGR